MPNGQAEKKRMERVSKSMAERTIDAQRASATVPRYCSLSASEVVNMESSTGYVSSLEMTEIGSELDYAPLLPSGKPRSVLIPSWMNYDTRYKKDLSCAE